MKRPSAVTHRGITYVEVLVIVLIIVVLMSIALPWMNRARNRGSGINCASNLRQIGQALLLYANDNGGHYPRTIYDPRPPAAPVFGTGVESPDPFKTGGPQPNDVTAALFLLLRTQDITSEVFTCPSSNNEKDVYGGGANAPLDRSNFTSYRKNLSYSFHNPYAREGVIPETNKKWWTKDMPAEFAVASDLNPGVSADGDNVLVLANLPAKEMKPANSRNHDKDGQNILYADGHVSWESSPFAGINRDNIFATQSGAVNASPDDPNDSVLLPTDD